MGPSLDLAGYSELPLYNIQAVAEATGIPAITLRSWERRYGLPRPQRDGHGYRLYSERDIATVRWLKERIDEGMATSRAVHLLDAMQSGALFQAAIPQPTADDLATQLSTAVQRLDVGGVNIYLGRALQLMSLEDAAIRIVQPALYQIGQLWERGQLSVTAEHVGSNILRAALMQAYRQGPTPMRQELIFVGSAPGEQHDIGALILALVLQRRGYRTIYIGASVATGDFRTDVARLEPHAVALSASLAENVPALAALYDKLAQEYSGLLLFGGKAINDTPRLAETVPGIWGGVDAPAAAKTLDDRLPVPA